MSSIKSDNWVVLKATPEYRTPSVIVKEGLSQADAQATADGMNSRRQPREKVLYVPDNTYFKPHKIV